MRIRQVISLPFAVPTGLFFCASFKVRKTLFYIVKLIFQQLCLSFQKLFFTSIRRISPVCTLTAEACPSRQTSLIKHASEALASTQTFAPSSAETTTVADRFCITRSSKARTEARTSPCHWTHSHRSGSISSWHNITTFPFNFYFCILLRLNNR